MKRRIKFNNHRELGDTSPGVALCEPEPLIERPPATTGEAPPAWAIARVGDTEPPYAWIGTDGVIPGVSPYQSYHPISIGPFWAAMHRQARDRGVRVGTTTAVDGNIYEYRGRGEWCRAGAPTTAEDQTPEPDWVVALAIERTGDSRRIPASEVFLRHPRDGEILSYRLIEGREGAFWDAAAVAPAGIPGQAILVNDRPFIRSGDGRGLLLVNAISFDRREVPDDDIPGRSYYDPVDDRLFVRDADGVWVPSMPNGMWTPDREAPLDGPTVDPVAEESQRLTSTVRGPTRVRLDREEAIGLAVERSLNNVENHLEQMGDRIRGLERVVLKLRRDHNKLEESIAAKEATEKRIRIYSSILFLMVIAGLVIESGVF